MANSTKEQVRSLRHSPAEHLWTDFEVSSSTGERGVALREIPFRTMIGIRVEPLSAAGARIAALVGALPAHCGQVVQTEGGKATLWLSPDEFLTVAPADSAEGLYPALVEALADDAGQVVELSSNRTTFELSGPSARAVLEKSCAADLHPRAFAVGTAITAEIGNIPCLLWKSVPETFLIMPRASFADYLGRWLLDGMAEFASTQGTPWP